MAGHGHSIVLFTSYFTGVASKCKSEYNVVLYMDYCPSCVVECCWVLPWLGTHCLFAFLTSLPTTELHAVLCYVEAYHPADPSDDSAYLFRPLRHKTQLLKFLLIGHHCVLSDTVMDEQGF